MLLHMKGILILKKTFKKLNITCVEVRYNCNIKEKRTNEGKTYDDQHMRSDRGWKFLRGSVDKNYKNKMQYFYWINNNSEFLALNTADRIYLSSLDPEL